jgi:hypothetical protein
MLQQKTSITLDVITSYVLPFEMLLLKGWNR